MGALKKEKAYTLEDIFALPEGERAELIYGKLFMMAPPSSRHQLISGDLQGEIYSYIKSKGGRCRVITAPFAVFLKDAEGNENYVEPDISVICDPDMIDEKGCQGAPDWIIEIVSPSARSMDYARKQYLYYQNKVEEYWIVDPMRETVVVYRQAEDWIPTFAKFGEKIRAGIYEDLELTVR